jgi:hypothetical protein
MHYYLGPFAIAVFVAFMLRPETKQVKNAGTVMVKEKSGFRVMAEYASSGIWAIGGKGPFRHGMVEHSSLKLPPETCDRFLKWIQTYEDALQGGLKNVQEFNATGLDLAKELKKHLGPNVYVEYQGERPDGGILEAVVID